MPCLVDMPKRPIYFLSGDGEEVVGQARSGEGMGRNEGGITVVRM